MRAAVRLDEGRGKIEGKAGERNRPEDAEIGPDDSRTRENREAQEE